jgi:hypothetical protein
MTAVSLYPAHQPGACQECDRAREQSPVWSTVHDPAGCPDCYILATATTAAPPVPYQAAPAPLATQAGLAQPASAHPPTVPALTHSGVVHVPHPDAAGNRPPVTRPRSVRRPGSA